jgi:hypothetical protein
MLFCATFLEKVAQKSSFGFVSFLKRKGETIDNRDD